MHTGPVAQFQRSFADWLGVGHAFAFWKGRVAMYAILKALGIGEGANPEEVGVVLEAVIRDVGQVQDRLEGEKVQSV